MEYFDDTGLFWAGEQRAARGGPREDSLVALARRLNNMTFDHTYVTPPLRMPPPGPVALDLETTDPDMTKRGPSWAFAGRGEIIGFAVAWQDFDAYYAIRHRDGNVDPEPVKRWVIDLLKRDDITIVGANTVYDLGWCRRELGLYPRGPVVDVQFEAALLDEYRLSYSLDSIARSYLGSGKYTEELSELEKHLGIKHTELMACLKCLPGPVVARYAAADARKTWDLHQILLPKIIAQGLGPVHDLESKLIIMSTEMRRIGMRVDVDGAEILANDIKERQLPKLQNEIKRLTGVQVEPWEAETCEAALETIGIKCARTRDGSPKITAEILSEIAKENILGQHILDMRKMSKVQSTFLNGHILRHHEKGRLHAEFNQLRSEREEDGFGTVTGRYSVTNPGLQQIPVRDPVWGPLVRSKFLPEEGQILASLDYSSQEPRLAIHFAYQNHLAFLRGVKGKTIDLRGIEETVETYIKNPRTDYHQFVADLCGIKRAPAKTLNLGLAYGMGGAKLARALGLPTEWKRIIQSGRRQIWETISIDEVSINRSRGYTVVEVAGPEAAKIIKQWEQGAPFVRGLFRICNDIAADRGFIATLLRRRCRFPSDGNGSYNFTHKAMNRLCQSSAADQTKSGMLALWESGIVPRLTVHDELVFSVDNEQEARNLTPYMENAVKLAVPTVVDVKCGAHWGAIPK